MSMHEITTVLNGITKNNITPRDTYECVVFDSKKDHCTELTTIDVSLKPQRQEISERCCM